MTRQASIYLLAVSLVVLGLALHPQQLHGQDKAVPQDDNALVAELNGELSDVAAEDELVDEATVEHQIEADLRESAEIDYNALEEEMEQGGTTIDNLILKAVKQAEADEGEQIAVFAQAGGKQVNGKSVERHFVADVRIIHDHVKENRRLRPSAAGTFAPGLVSETWVSQTTENPSPNY